MKRIGLRGRAYVALVAALVSSAAANAHDTYLIAESWTIAPGAPVTLLLTSAQRFPAREFGPEARRVIWAEARLGAGAGLMAIGEGSKAALGLRALAPAPGVLVAALRMGPRDIDLAPDDVTHYFDEINPSAETRAAYAALGPGATLRETYVKHAKAFLCAAPCDDARAASVPIGQGLEFVEIDPAASGARRFRLIADGAAAPGRRVALHTADGAQRALLTDGDGVVEAASLPPGPTLLSAVALRPPAREGARFTSDFATLTFLAGSGAR